MIPSSIEFLAISNLKNASMQDVIASRRPFSGKEGFHQPTGQQVQCGLKPGRASSHDGCECLGLTMPPAQ